MSVYLWRGFYKFEGKNDATQLMNHRPFNLLWQFVLYLLLCYAERGIATDFGTKEVTQYDPYLEWEIADVSFTNNPFDILATVTFTHNETGESHTTEMFYTGADSWKFRFTGTAVGEWKFTTQSSTNELDGHVGNINVLVHPDKNAKGFIRPLDADPSKWSRQSGEKGILEPFLPHFVMYDQGNDIDPRRIQEDIRLLLDEHGFTGIHMLVRDPDIWVVDDQPNVAIFEKLEQVIVAVHRAGYATHLWFWGDKSRKEYPIWGINGEVDQRLQRYIAARLGPLPSWTASYGFDLWEWVNGDQLNEWHAYMQAHFGWQHLLGARSEKNEFTQLSEDMDYSSYELHPTGNWYEQWAKVVSTRPEKPSFSEDRFRVRGRYDKDVTEEETRRGLYYSVLAGGAASIWGNLKKADGSFESGGKSLPYVNKHWIKTWSEFFNDHQRFLADMQPAQVVEEGYALYSQEQSCYIGYRENSDEIAMTINVNGSVPVIAVNTKETYQEISLGNFQSGSHTFELPSVSDWVIAVGDFGTHANPDPGEEPTPDEQGFRIQHLFLEGFLLAGKQEMNTALNKADLIPLTQPFGSAPWNYQGQEQLNEIPENVVDWILVGLRDEEGSVIERKACLLTRQGHIISAEGNEEWLFAKRSKEDVGQQTSKYVLTLHHKSHLDVAFEVEPGETIDPLSGNLPIGMDQMKKVGEVFVLYAGDYDGNQIINNLDINLWQLNSALVNQYVPIDADGNGIVNNLDHNIWALNRAKIGNTALK